MSSVTDIYTKHYSEERKKQFEDRVREIFDGSMSEESVASMVAEEFRTGKKFGGRMGFRNGMSTKKGIMQISENKTDKEYESEFEDPDYYKNTIEDMLKSYEPEEMSNLIGPFSMGYLMRSVSDYIEKGGDPTIAADLQIRVQDFINTQSENFQKLPKDEQDIIINENNKDFEENKNIIPGLPDNTAYYINRDNKTVDYEEAKNGGRMGFSKGKAVMTLADVIMRLTKGYIKVTGKKPEGLDLIKIKQEARQKLIDQNKVIEFPQKRSFKEEIKLMYKDKIDPNSEIGKSVRMEADAGKKLKKLNMSDAEIDLRGNRPYDTDEQIKKKLMDQNKKSLDSMKNKLNEPDNMATGGRAGYYGGGQAMVGEDLSEIGHGSDSLMARNMQLAPNSMATTSTGLNYLLGQDNDTARVPYKDAGPVILPKPKPKNFSKTLDMLNTKAAANMLDTKTYANLVGEFAKKAFDNGELSEVEYMRIIQPLFGEVGEMVTNQIQDDQNYLEKYAEGGRAKYSKGKIVKGIMNLFKKTPENTIKEFLSKRQFMKDIVGNTEKAKKARELKMLKDAADEARNNPGFKFKDIDIDKEIRPIFDQSKDRILNSDGGRIGYASKGDVSLLDFINVNASGSKSGKNQIQGAPEGITVDSSTINAIIDLDIPINEKLNIIGSYAYGKGRNKIEKGDKELFLDEGGYKDRNIGLGVNQDGEGLSGSVIRNLETGDDDVQIKFLKKFSKGGIAGMLGE